MPNDPNAWTTLVRRQFERPLFREPLLYFVLLGSLAFAVDHALRGDDRIIRITPSIQSEVSRSLEARLGRPAQADELQIELEQWKREEALYREGLKMHLLENDPVVRNHIASKLLEIARSRSILQEPNETELRSYFERQRDSYTTPPTYDFDQVFVSRTHEDAHAEAERLLSQLRTGASPEKMGDPFLLGHHIKSESPSRLSELFSEQLAKALPGWTIGEWNLVEGKQGYHVVRVTHVERPMPDFDKLRAVLSLGLSAERQENAAQAFAREIEGRYRFVSAE